MRCGTISSGITKKNTVVWKTAVGLLLKELDFRNNQSEKKGQFSMALRDILSKIRFSNCVENQHISILSVEKQTNKQTNKRTNIAMALMGQNWEIKRNQLTLFKVDVRDTITQNPSRKLE